MQTLLLVGGSGALTWGGFLMGLGGLHEAPAGLALAVLGTLGIALFGVPG